MRIHSTAGDLDGRLPIVQPRILRLEKGQSCFVRLLSGAHYGLFTHWHQYRSVYCEGKSCPPALHKTDPIWKGYLAVEFWIEARQVWSPAVLEVTEYLDNCWGAQRFRGQVWKLQRSMARGKKQTPLQATFCETIDESTLPQAFDIIPTLQHTFHRLEFDLTARNPIPAVTGVVESNGPRPLDPDRRSDNNSYAGERASADYLRKKLAEARLKQKPGESETPGKVG